jgi:hypothetical protein
VVISFVGEGGNFGYGTCMSHPNKKYIFFWEPMRRPKKLMVLMGLCWSLEFLSINSEKRLTKPTQNCKIVLW